MNCEVAQRQLLAAEDPDQEPDALRAHLAYCGECREWQARLGHRDFILTQGGAAGQKNESEQERAHSDQENCRCR